MGDSTAGEIAAGGNAEMLSASASLAGQRASASDWPAGFAPRGIAAWLRLAHPSELSFGLFPAAITLALLWASGARLQPIPAVFTLLALILVQAGAHVLNEYVEFERGRALAGAVPWGADAQDGYPLSAAATQPLLALRIAIVLLALGACAGIPLIGTGGISVGILGVLGLVVAVFYSSTNYALKRLPGGDIVVPLALGPGIAIATTLAQRQPISTAVWLVGLAFGLLALAFLLASTLRTRDEDERLGRRSQAVLLGVLASRLLFVAAVVTAYVLMLLVALPRGADRGAAAAILSFPAAVIATSGVLRAQNASARTATLGQTLRLYVAFALWLLVGLIAAGVVVRAFPHL